MAPVGSTTTQPETLASKAAILHTYKQDVQGLVRARQVSLVSALAAESDKETSTPPTSHNEPARTGVRFMIIASVALIVLGSAALFIAYVAYQTQLESAAADRSQVLASDSLIFVEHRVTLDVTDRLPRETLAELTRLRNASQATLGSITQILLQEHGWDASAGAQVAHILSAHEVLQAFGLSLSEDFYQHLGAGYLLGMHVADRDTPFILLTTTSYDHAFAALLEWEGRAETELSPLFAAPGTASAKRTVEDITIQNINARAVRDDESNLRLLYAFLDENTIIITNNIYTLTEVAKRYQIRKSSTPSSASGPISN